MVAVVVIIEVRLLQMVRVHNPRVGAGGRGAAPFARWSGHVGTRPFAGDGVDLSVREMDLVVAEHGVALVPDVRKFDGDEDDEKDVENRVQNVGEYRKRDCERLRERVFLVLLALAAALRRLLHLCVQLHDDRDDDERDEPRGRHDHSDEHHAEAEAHEAFGAQREEDDQTAFERERHDRVVREAFGELKEQVEQLAGGVRVARDSQREAIASEQQEAVVQETPEHCADE